MAQQHTSRSSSKENSSSPTTAAGSGASSVKSGLASMSGYAAQAAALSPSGTVQMKGSTEPSTPATKTTWTTIVRSNFSTWDGDGDGYLSMKEIRGLLQNPAIKGDQAAAVNALHKYVSSLEELSNDEYGDENDGVTLADLTAYERGQTSGKQDKSVKGVEGRHSAGKRQIDAADKVKKKFGKAGPRATQNELFPNGVPNLASLDQGTLGDCYFLAALGSVIARNPAQLVGMIKRNIQKGHVVSYTVTWPNKGMGSTTVTVPTDGEIARYSSAGADGLWLVVMEKAFAESGGGKNADIQSTIGEGGTTGDGMSPFVPGSTDSDLLSLTSLETTKKKLNTALNGKKKKIVTARIGSSNDLHLPQPHMYTIMAFDGSKLTIRNPWGHNPAKTPQTATGFKQLGGGRFTMTTEKFDEIFSDIRYEE